MKLACIAKGHEPLCTPMKIQIAVTVGSCYFLQEL